jgi:thioredoxin
VIIDFYADWCRPCKMVAPIMDELAQTYKGKVIFYKVNTDLERELSSTFQIRSIPAILYVPKDGKPQMSVGAQQKPAYIQSIQDILKVK